MHGRKADLLEPFDGRTRGSHLNLGKPTCLTAVNMAEAWKNSSSLPFNNIVGPPTLSRSSSHFQALVSRFSTLCKHALYSVCMQWKKEWKKEESYLSQTSNFLRKDGTECIQMYPSSWTSRCRSPCLASVCFSSSKSRACPPFHPCGG